MGGRPGVGQAGPSHRGSVSSEHGRPEVGLEEATAMALQQSERIESERIEETDAKVS